MDDEEFEKYIEPIIRNKFQLSYLPIFASDFIDQNVDVDLETQYHIICDIMNKLENEDLIEDYEEKEQPNK